MHEPFRTLPLDRRTVVEVAWLRLAAAAACVVGAVWLFAIGAGMFLRVLALIALAAAAGWTYAFFKARRTLKDVSEHFLALEPERLRVVGARETVEIAWSDVQGIEVDEDRLVLRVHASAGDVVIQPEYGGLGVYDLADVVNTAHAAAT